MRASKNPGELGLVVKRRVPRLQGLAKTLGKGELIGLTCHVVAANDDGIVGLEGEVVGETFHTLELRIGGPGGRRIQLAKVGATFTFQVGDATVEIDGAAIEFRPHERLKKVK